MPPIQRYGQDSVTVMSAYAAVFLIKVSLLVGPPFSPGLMRRQSTASETEVHVRAHRGSSTEDIRRD
jgi:hypothetical protein